MRGISIATVFFAILASPSFASKNFDFSDWSALLKENVRQGVKNGVPLSLINYKAVSKDPRFLKTVLRLVSFKPEFRDDKEKIAFWSNVYNIFAVKTVIDNPDVKSIRDVGSFVRSVWKMDAGKVGKKTYTLDHIEHQILRKLNEPRIHAAIVCASVSCPDLLDEAFTAERLFEQLDKQWIAFLSNDKKGLNATTGSKTIYLSKIFDWFENDFDAKGGIRKFASQYVPPDIAKKLMDKKNSIEFMDYDWSLNAK